jgi:prolyl-tRNA editing enzyme YbaK/EbsC (Cys-tRNA(Pro) deacylase)
MHAKALHVQETLSAMGVDAVVRELPDSTRTAQDAAAAIGTTVPQIAKSLIFTAGDDLVLVIASGSNRVSPEKIGGQIGRVPGKPDARTVKERTGFSIGGVPPVGHAERLVTLIDEDLLSHDEIWAAAGTPNAVFRIVPGDLVRITQGKVVDVKE